MKTIFPRWSSSWLPFSTLLVLWSGAALPEAPTNCDNDVVAPEVTCPADQLVVADLDCEGTLGDYLSLVTVTDDCDPNPVVSQTPAAGMTISGPTLITITATDAAGNVGDCEFTVTLDDQQPPTLEVPADVSLICGQTTTPPTITCTPVPVIRSGMVLSLSSSGAASVDATQFDLGSVDGCNSGTLTFSFSPISTDGTRSYTCSDIGQHVITIYLTDANGNQNWVETILEVQDPAGFCVAPAGCSPMPLIRNGLIVNLTDAGTATVVAQSYDIATDDLCGSGSLSFSFSADITDDSLAVDCSMLGVQALEIWATDGNGNQAFATTSLLVQDAADICSNGPAGCSPFGSLENGVIVGLPPVRSFELPLSVLTVQAEDWCASGSTSWQLATGGTSYQINCTDLGAQPVGLDLIDGNGNTTALESFVLVQDQLGACQGVGFATATDNCDPNPSVTYVDAIIPNGCPQSYTITRTWTATDAAGNSIDIDQLITVDDTTPPTIVCPGDQSAVLDGNCQFVLPDYTGLPSVGDNCDLSPAITQSPQPGTVVSATTTITLTATDACGNAADCTFDVLLEDTAPPMFNCPQNMTVLLDDNCNYTIPDFSSQIALTDNCDSAPAYQQQPAAGTVISETTTITLTVSDASGNSDGCSFVVTANNAGPWFSFMPPDSTVNCVGDIPGPQGVQAFDGCDGEIPVFFTQSEIPFGCPGQGEVTNTWIAQNSVDQQITYSQVVTINDTMPPVFNTLPLDTTITCYDPVYWLSLQETIQAVDNCNEQINVVFIQTTLPPCDGNGEVMHTWIAQDCSGNAAVHNQIVTINDTTPPVLSATPADIVVDCIAAVPGDPGITATDECDQSISVTFVQSALPDCPGSGVVTNTWTAVDCSGNETSWVQTVTIQDHTSPVLSSLPEDVTVSCVDEIPGDPGIMASDNCGETLAVQFTQTALPDCADTGTVTNTWTVTDCAGNTTTHSQVVTIDHAIDPSFSSLPTDITVSCAFDVPGEQGITALSHCGEDLTVSFSQTAPPTCVGNGAVVNTWTAIDCGGNVAIHSQYVTIEDTDDPVFSALPADLSVDCVFDVPGDPGILATDNCGETIQVVFTQSGLSGTCPGSGTVTNTWTATDCAGNTAIHVQTVSLNDTTAPTLSGAPADLTVTCFADVPGDPGITAMDDCEGVVEVVFSQSIPPACAGSGTVINSWTATDCAGNSTTHEQVITLQDEIAPELLSKPADITVACVADIPGAQGVTALDNCATSVQVVFTQEGLPFNYDDPEPVFNTWTATDCAGNVSTHTQMITVVDDQAPEPVCSGLSVALDSNGEVSVNPAAVGDGSTDNCGIAEYLLDQSDFDCSEVGENLVLLTVVDHFGNTGSCIAVVAVTASEACVAPPIANSGGPSISDPCSCLGNGKFGEEVVIGPTGGGQAWEVLTTTLINPATQQPYPAGTPLLQQSDGQGQFIYTLAGQHLDGQGYTLEAVSPFYPGEVLSISNLCYYPQPAILGLDDDIYCQYSDPQPLEGDANGALLDAEYFTINGEPATIFDPLLLGVGTHEVIYTVDAGTATGFDPSDPGCVASTSMLVTIVDTPVSMACNDNITISTNQDCEALITPDMILEGDYVCYDDYEVLIYDGINNISNPVTGDYLGDLLDVVVVHQVSGNSCSGTLTVLDVLGPVFDCTAAPVQITCTEDINLIPNPTATDNCTAVTYQLVDEVVIDDEPCGDNLVVIRRTWTATDDYGNVSAPCDQFIEISRPDDVDFPNDITWECDQYDVYPNITAPQPLHPQIAALQNGIQIIDATDVTSAAVLGNTGSGIPLAIDGQYCNYGVAHADQVLSDCGTTFQIVRTWTVLDWCTQTVVTSNDAGEDNVQIIKVKDVTAPNISLDPYQVSANIMGQHPQPCSSQDLLLPPIVSDNCHDWTVYIYTPVGEAVYVNGVDGSNGGLIPAPGLQLGFHTITYQVVDACNNVNELLVTIEVVDDIAPVAICDEITEVNLSSNGEAVVPADIFDDGSIDNCGVSHFEIRRLEDNCGMPANLQFNPTATFCCEDISQSPIMVVIRVYDFYDNVNECMVQVYVDDQIPPIISSCPGPVTINCEVYDDQFALPLNTGDYSVLDQFGTPFFYDNCEVTPNYTVSMNINSCLEGTIERTWTSSDGAGNSSNTCTQVITVEHVSNFVVEFPQDITVECTTGGLPDFGEPEVYFDECEMVATSWDDQYFYVVPDACYQIVRTWSVINWCIYDEFGEDVYEELNEVQAALDFDGDGDSDFLTFQDGVNNGPEADGYIIYEQVINVVDETAPVYSVPAIDGCIIDTDCDMDLVVPYPDILDDCSPEFEVDVNGSFGLLNDITGDVVIPDVAPGSYLLAYTITDNCGNTSFETVNFMVEDCKLPTPYCLSGADIEIMQTGMIDISASTFDLGSFDNCPGELTFSFSADVADSVRTYTCDDVGFQSIEIWVTDAAGNQDYCETFFILQDNMEVCDDVAIVAGQIATEDYDMMADIMVSVNGGTFMQFTGQDGTYSFSLPANADYTISPYHDLDAGNGVSTLDMLGIQKHILGLEALDSPYKMIAADANNTESISTLDLLAIQKVILGLETTFPGNTSWRFVEADYVFPDPTNPWLEPFPEVVSYNNLTNDQLATDFIGVKIGDVNLNAVVNLDGNPDDRLAGVSWEIHLADQRLVPGKTYDIQLLANAVDLQGFQFTLGFDPTVVEVEQIIPGLAGPSDFGWFADEGRITVSWSDPQWETSEVESILFGLQVSVNQSVGIADLFRLQDGFTKAEAYQSDWSVMEVELVVDPPVATDALQLYPNYPNPFDRATNIRFSLPEDGPVTLTIMDLGGRTIRTYSLGGVQGYQEFRVEDLPENGLLFYRLDGPGGTASGKLLQL